MNKNGYRPRKDDNPIRTREGFLKFREALEQDAQDEQKLGNGLPKDWRSRILK